MLPDDQKRILGYFIEEAGDHLQTLEQGLVKLSATLADSELINEVFRAAHSVKGGAAMLGLGDMQRTAHRLEDFFKLLKDSSIAPDRELESLLLQVVDGLQEQLNQLQSPFALGKAETLRANLEPLFDRTEAHLQRLITQSPILPVDIPSELSPALPFLANPQPEISAMQFVFRSDVSYLLREMLTTFKAADDQRSREHLVLICQRLYRLGEPFDLVQWCNLLASIEAAIGNPQHSYRSLAPVLIKDLKLAQELVLAGRGAEIQISPAVLSLVPPAVAQDAFSPVPLTEDDLNTLADLFETQPVSLDELWREEESTAFLEPVADSSAETFSLTPDLEPVLALDDLSDFLDNLSESWIQEDSGPLTMPEPGVEFEPMVNDPGPELSLWLSSELSSDPLPLEEISPPEVIPVSRSESFAAAAEFDEEDDGFGDLEKLLQDADHQLGGVTPNSIRRIRGGVNQRPQRRTSTLAEQTMRVSVGHLDNLGNLVGELVVNRNSLEQDQERLRQFLDNLLNQVQQLGDVGQRMRNLYERSLLESSLITNRQSFQLPYPASQGEGHATGVTFDALEMDRFTGFHTLSQEMIELIVRVREAASDIGFTIESTDQIARQFRQITTQLQEGLNRARMVPFSQIADRLPRAVRDISLKCGKDVRLVVEGGDTLIDQMLLERLYDPLTHLVNNALTHGIESPEERLALGKAAEGVITVRAFYQGNQTVIYIADDGAGINPVVIKAKALEKGLITPIQSQTMTDIEVYDLLFLPGFTTREQADSFSGRGVGMDVVRTALMDIRGAVTIESAVGKGTSFTIRLPLTLSITKALSCLNNQARIAFPMDGVEDMLDIPKAQVQVNPEGYPCVVWRNTLLPLRLLGDLLKFNRGLGRGRVYGGAPDSDLIAVVVLRSANTFIGVQVDQVIGEQEIVIKQLEGPVPKPIGIAGATVLGDGRVMPIADVLELIDLATGRLRGDVSSPLWAPSRPEPLQPVDGANQSAQTEPTVLIVDDSITVRELLSISFSKVGYRVEQARDGQEALEKLRSGLPCDLVFCDIEMPRMDGLELLSRLQQDDYLSQIPVAMLTSRGADRHRQMAIGLGAKGYFSKPYLEEVLLEAADRLLKGEVLTVDPT
ncbi:MAG: response regulator [Cyanobacteriota bacterium]|nr:response regulator [Cyanobacteriota bacterium]